MSRKVITWDEGWQELLSTHISPALEACEAGDQGRLTSLMGSQSGVRDIMAGYSLVSRMSIQRPPNNHCEQLYRQYKEVHAQYLSETVAPRLVASRGASAGSGYHGTCCGSEDDRAALLSGVAVHWVCYGLLAKYLRKVFMYLDQFHTKSERLPELRYVSLNAYRDVIFPLVEPCREEVFFNEGNGDGDTCDWAELCNLFDVMEPGWRDPAARLGAARIRLALALGSVHRLSRRSGLEMWPVEFFDKVGGHCTAQMVSQLRVSARRS